MKSTTDWEETPTQEDSQEDYSKQTEGKFHVLKPWEILRQKYSENNKNVHGWLHTMDGEWLLSNITRFMH